MNSWFMGTVVYKGMKLTEMTDTPAVVSLTFGLVLKCFFIFPATDNW